MHSITKFLPTSLFIAFITFYMPLANADKQSIPSDAINCSSLFYILTSLSIENQRLGQMMTINGMMMGNLYAVHKSKITGQQITKGDVTRLRDKKAKELGVLYDKNSNSVVDEFLFCDQWQESLSVYFSKQDLDTKNSTKIEQMVLDIPISPDRNKLDLSNKNKAKQIIDTGFQAWSNFNRITTQDARKMLEDMIKKNKK